MTSVSAPIHGGLTPTTQASKLKICQDPLRQVAEEFESVFIAQILNTLFEGVSTDGLMKGGTGERVFRSMMLEEYAKQMAHTQSIGIASAVEAQLKRRYESATQAGDALNTYRHQARQQEAFSLQHIIHPSPMKERI